MSALQIGDRVPAFSLPDQNDETFSSEEALAKGPLVLFFYPRDSSPGCTVEACRFRDTSGEFREAGAIVAGVSSDDVASHRSFADKHQLGYPLLADVGGKLRKKLGVPRDMLGLMEGRVTYVIDTDGILRHRFESALRVGKHVEEALATVRAIRRLSAPKSG